MDSDIIISRRIAQVSKAGAAAMTFRLRGLSTSDFPSARPPARVMVKYCVPLGSRPVLRRAHRDQTRARFSRLLTDTRIGAGRTQVPVNSATLAVMFTLWP